jgi:putative ABC transport system permease protein
VLGHKLKMELFGNTSPLGRFVRIGERRFRVIGALAPKGQSLGVDISDVAIIPVASASALFNRVSLFRILVQARGRDAIPRAKKAVLDIIRERHDGEDDITVITQDAMLATFDRIFKTLTLAVAGIAAISLAVAGILIMNVMLVAVSQRTGEIGLLKALGAPGGQILRLFLSESAMLSLVGAALGLLLAGGGLLLAERFFPNFPMAAPAWALLAAVGVALASGLVFGVMPGGGGALGSTPLDPEMAPCVVPPLRRMRRNSPRLSRGSDSRRVFIDHRNDARPRDKGKPNPVKNQCIDDFKHDDRRTRGIKKRHFLC